MRTTSLLAVIAGAVALLLAGCSATGTLVVQNGTSGDLIVKIEAVSSTVAANTSTSQSWDLQYFPLGIYEEDKTVTYSAEGIFTTPTGNKTAKVTAQKTTTVTVNADSGAISVQNTSTTYSIVGVYISPSTDTTWGLNDLTGTIGPGQTYYFRVDPNPSGVNYDVKLVDNYGYSWSIGVSSSHVHPQVTADGLWQITWDGYTASWGTTLASVAREAAPGEQQSTDRQSGPHTDRK
jgi:hypothetical protein